MSFELLGAIQVEDITRSGVIVVGFAVAWFILRRAGRRLVSRMTIQATAAHPTEGPERAQRIETLWTVAKTVLALVFLAALVFILLDIWGISIGPLLAVSSVVGVAVGFGAQDFIKDVIAGFLIVAEDQYSLDDVIRINGVSGTVESLRLRTTVLRDLDGNVHHVPNGSIVVASNLTQDYSRVVLDIGVAYKENVDDVIAVLQSELDEFAADPEWAQSIMAEPEILGVQELGDSAVSIRMLIQVVAPARWTSRRELLRRIKNRLDAEGIEIPFPYLTVVSRDPEPEP